MSAAPLVAPERDDGLLTASEVAQLKLDADWGDSVGVQHRVGGRHARGARPVGSRQEAFFYAGSRALLVSHWPVVSDAAVAITTRMLAEATKPGVGRAEAHRRAMMAMIDDKDRPHYAHPLFWAPFVAVAEGGVTKSKK